MPHFNFVVGRRYTRAEIADVIGLEDGKRKGGDWSTGYSFQRGAWFIFCNVGVAGRTGHDYSNRFEGDRLVWFGKTRTRLVQPQVGDLLSGERAVYIFFRLADRAPFEFAGVGLATDVKDGPPVNATWSFAADASPRPTEAPGEFRGVTFREGAMTQITVNAYERNPAARRACIEYFGCECQVCGINFFDQYGEIGRDFIHVHHLREVASIGQEYTVDPINDLVPVCPNCHAMLHRQKPPMDIDELRVVLTSKQAL